ncbi:hypothetical protein [Endozoicomonas sp. SCSIO W0465]|uniref:hypothetical protein n=1 Tax=Endozoicomonas sp. SCSIO W0465 TaxID=2918516 RepID=UPI002076284E|nr:hypothetical protein [Endozoicomonas sp. SCSIO W0465]USE35563.1 hypothetical protein MJO57_26310 [Endozoicomonas sp. SCSIO W0465]
MNCNQSLGYPGNTLGFIPDHAKQQTRIGVKRPFIPERADIVVVEDNIKRPHFHTAFAKQTLTGKQIASLGPCDPRLNQDTSNNFARGFSENYKNKPDTDSEWINQCKTLKLEKSRLKHQLDVLSAKYDLMKKELKDRKYELLEAQNKVSRLTKENSDVKSELAKQSYQLDLVKNIVNGKT